MASKYRKAYTLFHKSLLRRKVFVLLVITGFLFTCLEIFRQLPDAGNITGDNQISQRREASNVILEFNLNEERDVYPSTMLLQKRNVDRMHGRHAMVVDWYNLNESSVSVDDITVKEPTNPTIFSNNTERNVIKDGADSNINSSSNNSNNNNNKSVIKYNIDEKPADITREQYNNTHNNSNNANVMKLNMKERYEKEGSSRNIASNIADSNRKNLTKSRYNSDHRTNIKSNIRANSKQDIPYSVNTSSSKNGIVHQQKDLFFLKVHKAASTTVHNIILRFVLSRNLDVMLPRSSNILSETGYKIKEEIIHPYPRDLKFNVICNHIIFNKEYLSRYLKNPESTFYIGIVREPFSQFTSAFYYYLNTFRRSTLVKIALDRPEHPIRGFLEDPLKHEDARNYAMSVSFINNRMSADFGFPMWNLNEDKNNNKLIQRFLRITQEAFHLVMVVDLFDESMVLLRRFLHWTTKDVLYIRSNAMDYSNDTQNISLPWKMNMNFTADDRRLHRLYAPVDHALYDHFRDLLLKKMRKQPPDFMEEVKIFKKILCDVNKFCSVSQTLPELTVTSNAWTEEFKVSRSDCSFIQMNELDLGNIARFRQMVRYR